jgi:hypothetical protein
MGHSKFSEIHNGKNNPSKKQIFPDIFIDPQDISWPENF